jgi:hypothetical protein
MISFSFVMILMILSHPCGAWLQLTGCCFSAGVTFKTEQGHYTSMDGKAQSPSITDSAGNAIEPYSGSVFVFHWNWVREKMVLYYDYHHIMSNTPSLSHLPID